MPCPPRTVAGVTQAPAPEGRKLLRLEVRNAETPIERKPEWIKTRAKMGPEYKHLQSLVKSEGLHTVCQEAGCPNIFECWEDREATFLIGGDQCTRRCDFCQIDTGKPQPLDRDEPRRVAESVQKMELRYATITGVARDDLEDGGAWLYAETVRAIHELNPDTGVENLIPDFNGKPDLLREVFESRPEVLAHNVETVPRIFKRIRPAFRYERSLDVITQARDFGLVTKSNLILGMGETREEVSQALRDLHDAGCELVTITQYLRPSVRHHPVERWVKPEEFVELKDEAEEIGFSGVLSGPLVRSSYRAGRLYRQAMDARAGRRHRLTRPTQNRTRHRRSMAKEPKPVDPDKMSRVRQFIETYRMAAQVRPAARRCGCSACFLVGAAVGFALFKVLPGDGCLEWVLSVVGALLLGTLFAMIVFGRRAQNAAYSQMEGQPGAAAAALRMLRRGLEDRPGDRVHQAAGHRAPRGRPSGHRPGRRGQPQPAAPADGQRAPQARAGRRRRPDPRGRVRQRRGPGPAARSWSSTSRSSAARSSPPR